MKEQHYKIIIPLMFFALLGLMGYTLYLVKKDIAEREKLLNP